MTTKLSFQDLQDICSALGNFSDARSQEKPNKDLILTIKKINGKKILQTTRLSKMPWKARLARSFGFGESSLESVANFLHEHEPFLGLKISDHYYRRLVLFYDYTEEAVNQLVAMDKKELKVLERQKTQGYEAFKKCISDHNQHHSKKICLLIKEDEKEDLSAINSIDIDGVTYSWPNPMGILPHEDEEKLHERYKAPIIDANKFLYLHPFFINTRINTYIPPNILGFCHEYGLGAQKDTKLAIQNYYVAAEEDEYSACYNLARLFLKENCTEDAIVFLKKAENILLKNIDSIQKYLPRLEKNLAEKEKKYDQSQELSDKYDIIIIKNNKYDLTDALKRWNKDLRKIYLLFIEVYTRLEHDLLRAEYEKKTNFLTKNHQSLPNQL